MSAQSCATVLLVLGNTQPIHAEIWRESMSNSGAGAAFVFTLTAWSLHINGTRLNLFGHQSPVMTLSHKSPFENRPTAAARAVASVPGRSAVDSMRAATVAPLPPYRRLLGPLTQARIARLFLLYLTLFVAGSALIAVAENDHLRIFGMGLILPGGGFLAHTDRCSANGISHFAVTMFVLGGFGLSLALWFSTGNILAPPLIWVSAAIAAASMRHGGIRPGALSLLFCIVGAASLLVLASMGWRFLAARRQRKIDNDYLAAKSADIASILTAPPPSERAEMTFDHLQRLRFALDRALQPLPHFDGFDKLDQFQTAATRYQLNFLAYGIALTQARYMPAFGGYMHDAQVALIDKQRDHQVWKYWRLENLWGNLRWCSDPTARENIMFTGFGALQMALFAASTGRDDFNQRGRFTLVHPSGQRYVHDAHSLVASMQREFGRSAFHLMACEPNWIYPLCNTIGANAILAMDAQNGDTRWAMHERDFRHRLETEFLDGFGRYIPCRSDRTGLPFPAIGGAMPLAMPCFFLNALAPDLARRQWLLLRRQLFKSDGTFKRRAFWPIDTGNYTWSRASAYAATALAAAELGDERVYDECMQAFEDECPSVLKEGVIHRRKSSVWAHGVELMARAGARGAYRDLITAPCKRGGPRLEGLAYPDVLVASAHADGSRLHAVLYAGNLEGEYVVGLAGLAPGAAYRVTGAAPAQVMADAQGEARLTVLLAGRTQLTVEAAG